MIRNGLVYFICIMNGKYVSEIQYSWYTYQHNHIWWRICVRCGDIHVAEIGNIIDEQRGYDADVKQGLSKHEQHSFT